MALKTHRKLVSIVMLAALILTVIYGELIAANRVYRINEGNVVKQPYVQNDNKVDAKSTRMVIDYDAVVRDTVINGTVVITRDSRVLFENVTFVPLSEEYSEPYEYYNGLIEIYDSAKVAIRDSRIMYTSTYYSYMFLFGTAELKFENVSSLLDGTNIIVCYDSSKAFIKNTNISMSVDTFDYSEATIDTIKGDIVTHAFNNSMVNVYGDNYGYLEIYGFNNSEIHIVDLNSHYWTDIGGFDYSFINITNSNLSYGSILFANHYSYVCSYNSYLDMVKFEDKAFLFASNCDINSAEFYSVSRFNISYGSIGYIFMGMYPGCNEWELPGPSGVLDSVIINNIETKSMNIVDIVNSNVDYLYYSKVYNETVTATDTGVGADYWYINYNSVGSTINNTVEKQDLLLLYNATYAYINSSNIIDIYAYNTLNIELYYYANGDLMLANSNCDIYNATIKPYAWLYNSTLKVNGSNLDFQCCMLLSQILMDNTVLGFIDIEGTNSTFTLINSSISDGYIRISQFILEVLDVNVSSCSIYAYYSHATLNDTNFDGYIYLYSTNLECYNSYVASLEIEEMILMDGDFTMDYGMITEYNSTIISGALNNGGASIGTLFIHNISLYNATLYMYNTTIDPIGWGWMDAYVYVMENSSFIVGNTSFNESIVYHLYALQNSYIDVDGGTFYHIAINDSYAIFNSLNATYFDISNSTIDVYFSNISNMRAFNTTLYFYWVHLNESMDLIYSNVTVNMSDINIIHCGDPFYFAMGKIDATNIYIVGSNVSQFLSISIGRAIIDGSYIELLVYMYQQVALIDSTVYLCLNTSLFEAGDILMIDNILIGGAPIKLLNISGATFINQMLDSISINETTPNTVNLSVINSTLGLIAARGGNITVNNTEMMGMITTTHGKIYIKDTLLNASGEFINIFIANELLIDNASDIGMWTMIRTDYSYIHHVYFNSTIFIMQSTSVILDNCYMEFPPSLWFPALTIMDSDVEIHNTICPSVSLLNSTLRAHDSIIMPYEGGGGGPGSINLGEDSYLYGWNLTTDRVVNNPLFRFGPLAITYFMDIFSVKSIYAYLQDSEVTNTYIKYYVTDNYYGASIYHEVFTGEISLKTNYTNSNLSTARPVIIFEINDYGKIVIEGYKNDINIYKIMVNALTDTEPPLITPLNSSVVGHSVGMDEYLLYLLEDNITPTDYYVYLNDTLIDSGTYVSGETISINLASYISEQGYYVLRVEAYDSDANFDVAITEIYAEFPEAPVITNLNASYIKYEYGLQKKVCFQITEESPESYYVYLNGSEIMSGTYSSGDIICVELWNYIDEPGLYILRIEAYDLTSMMAAEEVEIKVLQQEAPYVFSKPDDTYNITVGQSLILNWTAMDASPDGYELYVNGELVDSNSWESNITISYRFNITVAGTYNVTIAFMDELGLKTTHTVIIHAISTTTTGGIGVKVVVVGITIGAITAVIIIVAIILLRKQKQ